MTINEATEIITNNRDFLAGSESIEDTADAWAQCPFGADTMARWVKAGCFDAASASDLHLAGISPEACGALRDAHGSTLAYSYCNGDTSLDNVALRVRS